MAGGAADVSADAGDSIMAFADTDASNSWTDLIGNDSSTPVPIPNADAEDIPANLEEVAARRGNSPNSYFPGASTQQLARLDQAVARSENAQTQIRQYDLDWRPSETSQRAPGSVEGAIKSAEARAVEAETRLDQLRFDLRRLGEFVVSLHGDSMSAGLFVPFPIAWKAVKRFMESGGELPTTIEWVASNDLPEGTFPVP